MTSSINIGNKNYDVSESFAKNFQRLSDGGLTKAELDEIKKSETDGDGISSQELEIINLVENSKDKVNMKIDIDGLTESKIEPVEISFSFVNSSQTTAQTNNSNSSNSNPTEMLDTLKRRNSNNETFTSVREMKGIIKSILGMKPPPTPSQLQEMGELLRNLARNLSDSSISALITELDNGSVESDILLGKIERTGISSNADKDTQSIQDKRNQISSEISNHQDKFRGTNFSINDIDKIIEGMKMNGASTQDIDKFLSDVLNEMKNLDNNGTDSLESLLTDKSEQYEVCQNDSVLLDRTRYNPLATDKEVRKAVDSDNKVADNASRQLDLKGGKNKIGGWSFGISAGTATSASGTVTGNGQSENGSTTATTGTSTGAGISGGGGQQTATSTVTIPRNIYLMTLKYERLMAKGTPESIKAAQRMLETIKQASAAIGLSVTAPTAPTVTAPTVTVTTPVVK
jgi:hypothetical protein